MSSIFASLNHSYTGLKTHQVMVNTTGHNIANANNEFYSRQRVDATARDPLRYSHYSIGQGVDAAAILRIHDEFVYTRYKRAAQEEQFGSTQFTVLREASAFFPEMDGIGLYKNLQTYFDSWTSLAQKSGDPAQKLVLGQNAETLSQSIRETRARLLQLQRSTNEELKVTIDEVNRLGKEIAEINKRIQVAETDHINRKANDLRDYRDKLEFSLSKLIGANTFKSGLSSYSQLDTEVADFNYTYNLTVAGGYTIVDGVTFHPLIIDNSENPDKLYNIYYEGQDYKRVDITRKLNEGKTGAILDVCLGNPGAHCNGKIGKLQQYMNDLDTFARGFIEATNSVYAQSSQLSLHSDPLTLLPDTGLVNGDYDIKAGSFDVVMYDNKGRELGRKNVKIDAFTTMHDVVNQLNANTDDNGDKDAINDFDDKFNAVYNDHTNTFGIEPKNPRDGIYISIQDKGTNFAGALGINRFFAGNSAKNIDLDQRYKEDPTLIRGYREAVEGNIVVANAMQQLQYEKVSFFDYHKSEYKETIADFFKLVTTKVAANTADSKTNQEVKHAVLVAVKQEHLAISEVSTDEELTNLIRFQGGYTANAKVVSTLDKMLDTLLGLKQ